MKNLIKFIVIIFLLIAGKSYSQDFQWVKGIRGANPYDLERSHGVDVDGSGNTYVTGGYGNPLDFGNSITLNPINPSSTSNDVFIAKYDAAGTCLWAVRGGGNDHDLGLDIAYDPNGFVYVTGIYSATATFGSSSVTSSGSYEVFVAKYSIAGVFQWVRSAGSIGPDWGIEVSSDNSGNCFIMGEFYYTMNFGGGVTTTTYGSTDVFVAKYNPTGNILWARHGGSGNHEEGAGLDVDNSGNAYITGTYHNTGVTFGTFTLPSVTGNDVYLVKYNSNGIEMLANNPGTTAGVRDASVSTDNSGSYYLQTIGSVTKFNSSGVIQWTRSCSGAAGVTGIKTNDAGQTVASGLFGTTADFGSFSLTSSGDWDVYVVGYDVCGTELWAKKCGGTQRDFPTDVSIDNSGNAFVTGTYQNTGTFGSFSLTSLGGNDAFTAKIGTSSPNVTVTPNLIEYATLGNAFNAINSGVHGTGAIVVNINNNTYETFTPVLNGNVFNTCTIRPTASVTVSPSPCVASISALILLDGADKVTVDGRIGGAGTTRSLTLNGINMVTNCIKMVNGATQNNIQFINSNGNASTHNIYIAQSNSGTGGNNSNKIENSFITAGMSGINNFGSTTFTNDDNTFQNNTINNCSQFGILIDRETRNNTIEGNDIFNTNSPATTSFTAIKFLGVGTTVISKNKIHELSFNGLTNNLTGIDVVPIAASTGTNTTSINVNNNFISLGGNPNCVEYCGIKSFLSYIAFTEYLDHNSIYINGTSPVGAHSWGILSEELFNTSSTYFQRNNISINERTGGNSHVASYINYTPTLTLEVDYNCYWAADKIANWKTIFYRNLPEYKCTAFPHEQNTTFKDVVFTNEAAGDLHLAGTSIGDFDLAGKAGTGISNDFDPLDTRSITAPYTGADESTPFNFNGKIRITAYIDGYPVPSQSPVNVTFEIRDNDGVNFNLLGASPYTVTLSTSGTATIDCPAAISPPSGEFYIVIKRPGCFETWSKAGGETMSTIPGSYLNYDFTSSPTQAYEGNMKYCGCRSYIFNGEIVEDGIIDILDYDAVINDALNVNCNPYGTGSSTTGNPSGGLPTDLTNNLPLHVDCDDLCMISESVNWIPVFVGDALVTTYGLYKNRPAGSFSGTPYTTQAEIYPFTCLCPRPQ